MMSVLIILMHLAMPMTHICKESQAVIRHMKRVEAAEVGSRQ